MLQPSGNGRINPFGSFEPLIDLIRQLVSFSGWRFGKVEAKSVVSFSCSEVDDIEAETKWFLACHKRQQRRLDPRAIAVVSDPAMPFAVTLVVTMPDGSDGMLMLLRDESLGAYTEHDLSLLALVKDLCEEWLASNLVKQEAKESRSAVMRRSRPMLFILDESYTIILGQVASNDDDARVTGTPARFVERLPPVIEDCVRAMTTDWSKDLTLPVDATDMPLPFLSVRVHSTHSADRHYLAVTIERMRRRNVLLRAAKRFLITPREREVVAYLLDGMRIEEIADRLSISVSTVNDHVKKLLERTGASNRSQMLARILGWNSNRKNEL